MSQEKPIGLEDMPDLNESAGQIVYTVQNPGGYHQVKAMWFVRQPVFICLHHRWEGWVHDIGYIYGTGSLAEVRVRAKRP